MRMWQLAINSNPTIISVTSWNEWGEGTQIEPAMSKNKTKIYLDFVARGSELKEYEEYPDGNPNFFIEQTRHFSDKYREYLASGGMERKILSIGDRNLASIDSESAPKLKDIKIRNNNGILEYL